MPVTVEWDNAEKTIVRMEMVGAWTWDEAYAGAESGYALLEEVGYEVGVIIDFSRGTRLPPNAITSARHMIQRRHPRTGLTVFVGANNLFVALWNTFSKVYALFAHQQNSVFADSVKQAREILSRNAPAGAGDKTA
ncbi:MAG: hypothetical protein HXY41_08775 [Chloroflexi bacterium]|nr:hypothetical protein [Chloroflexota bacterium]